ncbi:MAG: hypothetical protein Alpg2KO_05790 [Alphaproteobacteria bacterium]
MRPLGYIYIMPRLIITAALLTTLLLAAGPASALGAVVPEVDRFKGHLMNGGLVMFGWLGLSLLLLSLVLLRKWRGYGYKKRARLIGLFLLGAVPFTFWMYIVWRFSRWENSGRVRESLAELMLYPLFLDEGSERVMIRALDHYHILSSSVISLIILIGLWMIWKGNKTVGTDSLTGKALISTGMFWAVAVPMTYGFALGFVPWIGV